MQRGHVEHAPVEVEADAVLQVLPAAEQPAAVGDLGVAGDRAHAGVGQRLHQRPTASGSKTVSPSTSTRMSPRATRMPVLSAAGLPALACADHVAAGSIRRTMSAVPSVDPSSTTITSTRG